MDTLHPFAQEQLAEGIARWPKTLETCLQRAKLFSDLQIKLSETNTLSIQFEELQSAVHKLEPLLRESTATEKEGYDQICFQGSPWSGLNSIPFALVILSIYKSYIIPAFGILLPFVTWILPYILLKAVYNIPISFSDYSKIMWRMWNGGGLPRTPAEFMNPPVLVEEDITIRLRRIVQNGWTIFTVGQAVWQPIQQSRHFMRLDTTCLELGKSIVCVKGISENIYRDWSKWLPPWLASWIPLCPTDIRQAFAFANDYPLWLRFTLRALGRFEVIWRLASRSDVVPAEFVKSDKPILMLKDFGDPSIPIEKRIVSSIRLDGHSILTGPNRGGKSSFLRGIVTNVRYAHAFGAVFAKKGQMSHFTWIADGMRLDDTPGKTSMFEREVGFASSVLNKRDGCGLVLYDELFHSTNPPDATRTSQAFCNFLWKKDNCISVISTHIYSLANGAPESVKRLCVGAWKDKNCFKFSYKVQKGVCEVSSVDLLLKQFNLLI